MKSFKKYILLVCFAGSLAVVQSCQKYEDGPMISLTSRKNRVANTWKVDNYKINGTDYTSLVTGYEETFSKDGAYAYDWGILDGSGTWAFKNNEQDIQLSGSDDHASRKLTILKLEEDQFWYTYLDGNDKYEMHLITK